MHPRNKHQDRYDLKKLSTIEPKLTKHIFQNHHGIETVNFFDPEAVKTLNKALLSTYYDVKYWDIPPGYLTPPIPGRADYIHYLQDLFGKNTKLRCLEIGTGANCIYPLLGTAEYGWKFVATETDRIAISNAKRSFPKNAFMKGKVELRAQKDDKSIFKGIVQDEEKFDMTMCNPPFHASSSRSSSWQ